MSVRMQIYLTRELYRGLKDISRHQRFFSLEEILPLPVGTKYY